VAAVNCCAAVRGADCHCAQCHLTFSSLRLFDRHLDVDYRRPHGKQVVLCRAPASLGLVRDYRGTWTTGQAAISRQRRAAAMAERRRAA
jgi:hypothetical protein